MKQLDIATRILMILVGFALMGGALAAWHYFEIAGIIAWIIAGAGLAAVGRGLGLEFE
jgi:hypothetical protein